MSVSKGLRRLLHVRRLEEEQRRVELATAMSEVRTLEQAVAAAANRRRAGRMLTCTGDPVDRQAGLVEMRNASRQRGALQRWLAHSAAAAEQIRSGWTGKRVERKQAEALLDAAAAEASREAGRLTQQGLDQWYLDRRFRASTQMAEDAPRDSEAPGNSSAPEPNKADSEDV